MKKASKYVVGLLILVVLLSIYILPQEESNETATDKFSLSLDIKSQGIVYNFKWWQTETENGTEWYFAIPYSLKDKETRINFTKEEKIVINNTEYKNGQRIYEFNEGLNQLSAGEENINLYVYYTSDIPMVYIKTDSGSMEAVNADLTKETRESGNIVIISSEGIEHLGGLEYIKGRGNGSWFDYNQKPYNIKLSEKANLFKMGLAKEYALKSLDRDVTNIKNSFANKISEILQINCVLQEQHVDLYIDGEYYGLYTLSEKVEADTNRVPVYNLEKANKGINNIDLKSSKRGASDEWVSSRNPGLKKWVDIPRVPDVITGGYILEFQFLERYDASPCGFVSDYGQPVVLKSPEYASKEQVEYISEYYQDFENAVLNEKGYNDKGKHYSEYIDMDSFVKMCVLQEYSKNLDAGTTSCYVYKDVDGKMISAPPWDFDAAFGYEFYRFDRNTRNPYGRWATDMQVVNHTYTDTIFTLLYKQDDFKKEVEELWNNVLLPQNETIFEYIDKMTNTIEKSASLNRLKRLKLYISDYETANKYNKEQINNMKDFLQKRADFLTEYFNQ